MDHAKSSDPSSGHGKRPKGYPEPVITPPSTQHTHTLIFLHGRGSNGERFGLEFLKAITSSGKTLRELYPGMKFIFPTAKKRRASAYNRATIHQWFDLYSLENPSECQDSQYDGIRESSIFLHQLIDKEAEMIGLSNVVIGGLSQGCAIALHVALNYTVQASDTTEIESLDDVRPKTSSLGGFVGMSGWLPFADDIRDAAIGNSVAEEDYAVDDDLFEHSRSSLANIEFQDSDYPEESVNLYTLNMPDDSFSARQLRAANFCRDIIDLPLISVSPHHLPPFAAVPFFLGHGALDEKVTIRLGEEARDALNLLGLNVTWKVYGDLGHWYKVPNEIDDIVEFLKEKVGVESVESKDNCFL